MDDFELRRQTLTDITTHRTRKDKLQIYQPQGSDHLNGYGRLQEKSVQNVKLYKHLRR